MSTLLVNPKMDPMLAARIEASVSGHRKTALTARSTARVVSLLRLAVVVGILALVVAIALTRHGERVAFERSKAGLFEDWEAQSASLTAKDREFLPRLERLLTRLMSDDAGDYVDADLKAAGAFGATLARRTVYVRGPTASFTPYGLAKAAAESGKDALLLCLLDPPASPTEKSFLPKARIALAGGVPVQQLAPNVYRLHDAEVGLPYLLPVWGERVQTAKDAQGLSRLERDLKKAPISAAKKVLGAEVLIAILDEPNDSGGVTELDGEHAHSVRVVLWDLGADKPLLKMRRQVDPAWITPNRRSQYARELDSCKLALAVHDLVRGSRNQ